MIVFADLRTSAVHFNDMTVKGMNRCYFRALVTLTFPAMDKDGRTEYVRPRRRFDRVCVRGKDCGGKGGDKVVTINFDDVVVVVLTTYSYNTFVLRCLCRKILIGRRPLDDRTYKD